MNQQKVNEHEGGQQAPPAQQEQPNGLQPNEATANQPLLVQGPGINSAGAQLHHMGQYDMNYYQPQMLMRVQSAQAGSAQFDPHLGGMALQGQHQPVAGNMMQYAQQYP